jgi:putative nucleotidyltransferase with HDIG domain
VSSRILITENDRTSGGQLTEWLQRAGYQCVRSSTDDALANAERYRCDAALVSVDHAADGSMDTARLLATRRGGAAVIVVARPDLEVALEAARAGAVDCLPWPSSEDGVLETVERAVRYRESASASSRNSRGIRAAITHGVEELKSMVAGAHAEVAQAELLSLLDLRSPETFAHAQRVASATAALASDLGVPVEHVTEIRRAALLHDIGKVAIPGELLERSGPLDDDEISLLRMHVSIGAEVLHAVPALEYVAEMVAATHERFDGRGYPDRKRGLDIPFGARIIAVADVYDALTSIRPYRDPLTHDEANLELTRVAGSQLDPDVVRAWIRMTDGRVRLKPDATSRVRLKPDATNTHGLR